MTVIVFEAGNVLHSALEKVVATIGMQLLLLRAHLVASLSKVRKSPIVSLIH